MTIQPAAVVDAAPSGISVWPDGTPSREGLCGGKSLNRLREEKIRYHSIPLVGIAFQACSLRGLDISPILTNAAVQETVVQADGLS